MMSCRRRQGLSPAGTGTGGVQRSIALRFISMSISMYWLVVVMLTCPSHDLMTLSSTPALPGKTYVKLVAISPVQLPA